MSLSRTNFLSLALRRCGANLDSHDAHSTPMDEDWDDTIPAWIIEEEALSQGDILRALMPLAEMLTKSNAMTFRGVKGEATTDGDFTFERVSVEGYEDVHLKFCYFRGGLASVAVCHNAREAPQIILEAPDYIHESIED